MKTYWWKHEERLQQTLKRSYFIVAIFYTSPASLHLDVSVVENVRWEVWNGSWPLFALDLSRPQKHSKHAKSKKKKEKSVFTFYKHTINKTGSCEISNMYNICYHSCPQGPKSFRKSCWGDLRVEWVCHQELYVSTAWVLFLIMAQSAAWLYMTVSSWHFCWVTFRRCTVTIRS